MNAWADGHKAYLLLICVFLWSSLPSASQEITGIGAGMGVDVEYVTPQRFKDPGDRTRAWFPVKFICGETQPTDRLAQGRYSTVINVLNLSKFAVDIGWWFSAGSGRRGITGARAHLEGHGSLMMDCDFIITNLRTAAVPIGPFVEGFVSIEDLNDARQERIPTRVAAVYSALHKQLHGLPDLLPLETQPAFCNLDDQNRLVVTIKNQGEADAGPSTTRIAFLRGGTIERATSALTVGGQTSLEPVPLPPSGEGVSIVFTITADVPGGIQESNEANNTVIGACIAPVR